MRARPDPTRGQIRELQERARSEPTRRQLEVLQLVADGLPDEGVAEVLGVSKHTVREHAKEVRRVLGVKTRAEAVAVCLRRGLIA